MKAERIGKKTNDCMISASLSVGCFPFEFVGQKLLVNHHFHSQTVGTVSS